MNVPLDELYLPWLYSQVGSVDETNPSQTYWRMLRRLYNKEFIWLIPHDDNRAVDGRELRIEFRDQERLRHIDRNWFDLGCSVLEMLVALSRRLSFQDDGPPDRWFWCLIENLGLEAYNDNMLPSDKRIDDILGRLIWRTYKRNGVGGLFPLKIAREDQRELEIWYQMHSYLQENGD